MARAAAALRPSSNCSTYCRRTRGAGSAAAGLSRSYGLVWANAKPGVCVRLTRMTVSESAADVGLPQKRKSGDVNDDPVLAARDGRTSGQKPESQIEPGAQTRPGSGRSGEATHTCVAQRD